MAWVAPVLTGLGGLTGLFGNRPQIQKTTSNTQGGSVNNTTFGNWSQQTPQLNPLAGEGYKAISDKYMNLINTDPNLSGYQAQQSGQINNLADIQRRKMQEELAARGISGPAAATAEGNIESQRFGNLTNLNQQIPLLSRQLQENTLGAAGSFYRGMPVGQYNEATGNQTTGSNQWNSQQGTSTSPGNQLGGLFGGLGDILAMLYGRGALGGGGGGGSV